MRARLHAFAIHFAISASKGKYISKGTNLIVLEVEGVRIVVKEEM